MDNMHIANNEIEEIDAKGVEISQGNALSPAERQGSRSTGEYNPKPSGDLKKTRLIIAIITLIISLAFIIAGSVLLAEGGSSSGRSSGSLNYDETLITGSNYTALGSDAKVFKFVPSYTGYHRFYTNVAGLDSYATLKDSSGTTLTYNDNGGYNDNFSLSYYLYSGSTYYLEVTSYSGSTYCYIYVHEE